ncbi:MAG: hypothetical protein ACOC1Q_03705 [Desulfosalsimonas sp.]
MKKLINTPGLCITGLGLMTSVGHDAKTACASIRANLKRPVKLKNFYVGFKRQHEDPDDGLVTGHPVLAGSADDTEDRIFFLLGRVLQDLFNYTGENRALLDNVPVYVSLPEDYRKKTDPDRLQSYLAENPDMLCFSCKEIVPFYHGHASMIAALAHAAEAIAEKNASAPL